MITKGETDGFGGAVRTRVFLADRTALPRSTGYWADAVAPVGLGLFCLKSYVERIPELATRVDIEVRTYAVDQPNDLILHEILEYRPDIVGLTCQPWNYLANIQLGRLLKKLKPAVVVLGGGPIVVDAERYLRQAGPAAISIAVAGEAEETFADLLRHFALRDRPLDAVAGITYFDAAGQSHRTCERPALDLSTLPSVMSPAHLAAMGPFIPYETSRGCTHPCPYCNWSGRRYGFRLRNRAVIEQDLAAILAARHVTNLAFVDSAVDADPDHAVFVAEVIKRHRHHPVRVGGFFFFERPDLAYVEALRGAFDYVEVGVQVASNEALNDLGRNYLNLERFERIRARVLPLFPDHKVDLMFGLPGTDHEQLLRSLQYLLERDVRHFRIFRLQPLPGTRMGEDKEHYGIVSDDDYPFMAYSSRGTSVDEMMKMQQLKVNIDALRPILRSDIYLRLRRAGVDALDFAVHLHTLVPRLNHRLEYGLAEAVCYDPDLVAAIFAAAGWYAKGAARTALIGAMEEAYNVKVHADDSRG